MLANCPWVHWGSTGAAEEKGRLTSAEWVAVLTRLLTASPVLAISLLPLSSKFTLFCMLYENGSGPFRFSFFLFLLLIFLIKKFFFFFFFFAFWCMVSFVSKGKGTEEMFWKDRGLMCWLGQLLPCGQLLHSSVSPVLCGWQPSN